MVDVLRYAAFSSTPGGGNPAGVVLDASGIPDARMQAIAADVGFSETAFVLRDGEGPARIRYFAPEAEVDFCGHATIATGVALGEHGGPGEYPLLSRGGPVGLTVRAEPIGYVATLESPPASAAPLTTDLRDRLLGLLGWSPADLDSAHPPGVGIAGNRHPILVAASLERLAHLDYDFLGMQRLCREQGWPTVQLIAGDGPAGWRSRNPFAYGGVVEDAATGAAAAAFGAYLRSTGRAVAGDRFVIRQGLEMGRPSTIEVEIGTVTVFVSGTAVRI